MYSTGKITTTANNTKVVGTNTKWKDNNSLVSPEQVILIQNGATIYINSIASIQSNTEMTLSFPVPAAVKDAAYNILTTMVHSVSDAANKIVAMNNANVQFSDVLNRWATETGTITVTLPDGTTQQLRTAKEMDKQLDGKFDKAGGAIIGTADVLKLRKSDNNAGIYLRYQDATGVNTGYIGYVSNTASFSIVNQMIGSSLVLAADKTLKFNDIDVMRAGDFGWGGSGIYRNVDDAGFIDIIKEKKSQIIRTNKANSYQAPYGATALFITDDSFGSMCFQHTSGVVTVSAGYQSGALIYKNVLYGTANTTKDANGNLKAASPIVKIFADHIEINDESEGVQLEKLGVGRYKLKGVLGMNSDASWGGYHGGLVIPNGVNNLPLVWADFKVEADGDIIIETHYRKHADLPPPVVLNRLITYPEFMDENGNELDSYTPCDIPNGHWIDVRVNMPSDSLYNQKQAEAQRLAEIEAERLAKEEAERIAEEAERAEQEAVERDLPENTQP